MDRKEEQYSGIKISYTLTKQEIISCLWQLDKAKQRVKKMISYSIILAIAGLSFLVSYLWFDHEAVSLFVCVLCGVLILILWGMLYSDMQNRAGELDDKIPMELEIFPNEIKITKKYNERKIPLDKTSKFAKIKDLFMIFTPDQNIIAIPLRCIEPEFMHDIEAMISSGALPA